MNFAEQQKILQAEAEIRAKYIACLRKEGTKLNKKDHNELIKALNDNDPKALFFINQIEPKQLTFHAKNFGFYPEDDICCVVIINQMIKYIPKSDRISEKYFSETLSIFNAEDKVTVPDGVLAATNLMAFGIKYPKYHIPITWICRYLVEYHSVLTDEKLEDIKEKVATMFPLES